MFRTVALLICSNVFMTIAWYGHLRFKGSALWVAILASWLIALPEYALQVPANRLGYIGAGMPVYQLKILQEAITFAVFIVFAWAAFGEIPGWRQALAFGLIVLAVAIGTPR